MKSRNIGGAQTREENAAERRKEIIFKSKTKKSTDKPSKTLTALKRFGETSWSQCLQSSSWAKEIDDGLANKNFKAKEGKVLILEFL